MLLFVTLILVFMIASIGTGVLRWLALRDGVLDIPNERSSHTIPTPRAGGVAIVVAISCGALALWLQRILPAGRVEAIAGAGVVLAVIGFIDDHTPVLARWRLPAHFIAAWWVIHAFGGVPPVYVFGHQLPLGGFAIWLGIVTLAWLLNLYNFMDGIDGIAGVEAVTVCIGAVLLAAVVPEYASEWRLPLVVACAAAGFLVWNLPPAKVFMGDAGSCFLGLTLGAMGIMSGFHAPQLVWSWLILLGVFIVDATVTLIQRILLRERISTAHRSHAYQHATQRIGRHAPVTAAIAAINMLWLTPLALLVGTGRLEGVVGLIIAYLPLVVVARRLKAGVDLR
jgi:Fuc2NAc and GlcNAc transferase